jgi:hypothetical protein
MRIVVSLYATFTQVLESLSALYWLGGSIDSLSIARDGAITITIEGEHLSLNNAVEIARHLVTSTQTETGTVDVYDERGEARHYIIVTVPEPERV